MILERCFRPWGFWEVLDDGPWYKVKRLYIEPSHSISMQYHNHRSETWTITEGTGDVILDDKKFKVTQGDSFIVPVKSVHKVTNTGKTVLKIIEVQCGEIVAEDDIVRLG